MDMNEQPPVRHSGQQARSAQRRNPRQAHPANTQAAPSQGRSPHRAPAQGAPAPARSAAAPANAPVRQSRARAARNGQAIPAGAANASPHASANVAGTNQYSRANYANGAVRRPAGPEGAGSPNGKPKKKMNRGKKIALVVLGVLLAAILGVGIAVALWVNSVSSNMGFEDDTQLSALKEALAPAPQKDESFYMLVLGSDARGNETSRSDVIMLARLDPAEGTVHLVSVPRDTMVTINGYTQKINAAYAIGGPALAVQTVSEFAGVPISHYAEIHFNELIDLVDMLGGVTVNVPESFSAGNGGISLSAGVQTLSGEEALGFARERYNVSGGDFGRAQAQRLVAMGIIESVLATPATELPGVVAEAATCVSTDMGITDIVNLALEYQKADLTMYQVACPSYSQTVNGASYACTMFDEWVTIMQRVDAGLDPEDESAVIPDEQLNNAALGAAPNSPAPRDYHATAAASGWTTDIVADVN